MMAGGAAAASTTSVFAPYILILLAIPAYCFYMYFRAKVTMITIQYAGGEIGFDKKWFTQQEIELFEKQIRIAKDRAIEAGEIAVANKLQEAMSTYAQPVSAVNSKADELIKIADLYTKGIITQEEFEKMKKELI